MYQMLTGVYAHCDKTNLKHYGGTVGKIGLTGRAKNIKNWKKIAELGIVQGFLICQTKSKVTTSSTYKATTGAKKMGFHAQNDVKEISRIGQWSTSELTLVAA
jgi:hypothetical protein